MKISEIKLKGFNQFKDVSIPLVYPYGHEKEGEPLDKVCIIGQSGTGKTSLLRVIKLLLSGDRRIGENTTFPELDRDESVRMTLGAGNDKGFFRTYTGNSVSTKHWGGVSEDLDVLESEFKSMLSDKKTLLINYPAELLCKDETSDRKQEEDYFTDKNKPRQIVDFSFEDVRKIWDYILQDIKEHRAKGLFYTKQIAEEASKPGHTYEDIEKKTMEYKEWLSKNPNPLNMLAEKCLDPVLFKLGLKTKTDIDLETIRNLGAIQLETLAGQYVPRSFWSTGTQQLVQTLTPLYQLKPDNAVVLIDEPERSLYPDIQRSIIDSYVNLAPGCQFFFATHSPIIASAFEPWEIVELKFDEDQTSVYQEKYYEGERHKDNYKYYPEYLRWDSILFRIFDLPEEGGRKRQKALEKLAEIKVRLKELKEKGKLDTPDGKKLVKELEFWGRKVDWDLKK